MRHSNHSDGVYRTMSGGLFRTALWCLGFASLWYVLGAVWALGFGLLGVIFELTAYLFWAASAFAKAEEEWNANPIEKLVKFRRKKMTFHLGPRLRKTISLEGIEAVELGELNSGSVGLIFSRRSGKREQIYLDTRHPKREEIPRLIRSYLDGLRSDAKQGAAADGQPATRFVRS